MKTKSLVLPLLSGILFFNLILFSKGVLADPPTAMEDFRFDKWVRNAESPQLYFDNEKALQIRLQLIENAPKNSTLKIATFEFIAGQSTEAITQSLCRASQRGVKVQMIVDSHFGGDPLFEEAFNRSNEVKKNQEMYQYLANCGVIVKSHNTLANYIEVMGTRIPNIYLDSSRNHEASWALTAKGRIDEIVLRVSRLLDASFAEEGVTANTKTLLYKFEDFALFMNGLKVYKQNIKDEKSVSVFVESFKGHMRRIILDPTWDLMPAEALMRVKNRFVDKLRNDSITGPLTNEVRAFNRLNHKKLLLLETDDGNGCLIIGGRNLGDHYLTNRKGAFHDTDVLLCKHHGESVNSAFQQAEASFNDLMTNTFDPGDKNPIVIKTIPSRPQFKFKLFNKNQIVDSKIPKEILLGDASLNGANQFSIITSEWSYESDKIRAELLKNIRSDDKEIFIETPYAQFDSELLQALEEALARGVRVTILTNGLFTSDGPSKMIRFTMANAFEVLKLKYSKSFFVLYTTPMADRMTHSKLAVFRGQKNLSGQPIVRSIVGSHNFHPRSSLSDKEHAIVWEEAPKLDETDLIGQRLSYYDQQDKNKIITCLKNYKNLLAEIYDIKLMTEIKNDDELRNRAAAYTRILKGSFIGSPDAGRIFNEEAVKFRNIQIKLEKSGLTDVLGQFL